MNANLPPFESECFFITPIGEEGSETRKRSDGILRYIVNKAAEEVGLSAVRADQIADPGQINLQVIDHVLNARAAVADLTGLNPNVFYEVAVRHTARLPLVLIAEKGCKLPFDIANMRTIFFDHTDLGSADDCRAAIAAGLDQALNKGVVDSPIATTLDVRSMSAGSAVERGIADILQSVQELTRMQRSLASIHEWRDSLFKHSRSDLEVQLKRWSASHATGPDSGRFGDLLARTWVASADLAALKESLDSVATPEALIKHVLDDLETENKTESGKDEGQGTPNET
ncbi:hypothetical protein [Arthrobacter sp. FW306-2-2C-D06B]|uniref:hypothetical protein n=1 Tax=Arthrobacter sp. FW306-2-2C-D06B TaxID=2879618 RepID=UPI001F1E18AB|nr:hypothetical protein [Arthrobacter sp. FW306-2-2C-D06B]UKA59136.1 hypothetical protein LFT47_01920 [Arthrobacter sp. FW306-2-2C-D06B]